MAAEAVSDRSGSGLTNATTLQAVALETELHGESGWWTMEENHEKGKWLWLRGG